MLHKLFEKTVMLYRNKTALSFENQEMSYELLNMKSNQLANELISNGVKSGDYVAMLMNRSLDMVIGILAILKAGGTYVPIEPEYPDTLIEYIINDCMPKMIVTSTKTRVVNGFSNIKRIYADECKEVKGDNPNIDLPDNALAYIIYTSGSTGKRKGVMVEHRNVVSLLNSVEIKYTPSDIWTLFHSISFDFSVWELFGSLLSGGKLIIVPNRIRQNLREYRSFLIDNKVTILNQTPTAFYSLQMEELKYKENEMSLTHIIFGGEKLVPSLLKEWHNKYPKTKLINMYGITEIAIHASYKELNEEDILHNTSNIGKALPHLKIHLVNDNSECKHENEVGEICIEGEGVARGYINNISLTNERFVVRPNISKNKLYLSGDLGRYLTNGDIEYIGRIDNQVKIRGHRIELEEIEACLNEYKDIKLSVVVAVDSNETDKMLKVYYTSDINIDSNDIVNYLLEKLPQYMIPTLYSRVESFVMTSNGKIDRRRISECSEVKPDSLLDIDTTTLSILQNNILQVIISNNNNLHNISLDKNLTDIGFDSITLIKLIIKLEEKFNFSFDNQMLFNAKRCNIRTIVEYVESKLDSSDS